MRRLQVGVIGLGEIGGAHCASIATLPQAQLVAVADLRADVVTKVAGQYGATAYETTEELLAHPGIEAVIIALPDQLHLAAAVAAAAAGKAMLVEKPLAVDAQEAKAIVRAAEAALRALDDHGVRSGILAAVEACTLRSQEMSGL